MDGIEPIYGPLPPFKKPTFATQPVLNLPKTFHGFSQLPPELQLQIWEHALSECYQMTVATVPIKFVDEKGKKSIRMETVVKQSVVKRRWRPLMLACKTSNEVAGRERRERYA